MFECPEIEGLFDPALYWRNPYNVVGLQIFATAREIRRRKEDASADAFANGSSLCSAALLPSRIKIGPPEMNAAFEDLEDPYPRAFYSLFWFWPMTGLADKSDRNLSLITSTREEDRNLAVDDWRNHCRSSGQIGVIARHNLAVYYHLMALFLEDGYMNGGRVKCEDCDRCWGEAISFWDSLADDDEFWGIFVDHVRSYDDPRMTSGFVRRIRHDLPLGLDQINARLLHVYLKKLDAGNVARQVKYMNQSQQGLDDVESSLGPIVGAVEKMQDSFSADIESRLSDDSNQGLLLANRVLEFGYGMKDVAKSLAAGTSINESRVADDMALLALHCQVSYVNATKDWGGCESVLKKTLQLAVGESARERIANNLKILEDNLKGTECVVCHRRLKHPETAVRRLKFCGDFKGTPAFESLVKELEDKLCGGRLLKSEGSGNWEFRHIGGYHFSMHEDYYLEKLMAHPDFGKICYSVREARVLVCDECYGTGSSGCWVSQLPLSKEGWILGAEPSERDISNAVEGIIRRVIPFWNGYDDYKKRRKKAKKEYDKTHLVFGMREEFADNLSRSVGCMVPLTAIIAITILGLGLIVLA